MLKMHEQKYRNCKWIQCIFTNFKENHMTAIHLQKQNDMSTSRNFFNVPSNLTP